MVLAACGSDDSGESTATQTACEQQPESGSAAVPTDNTTLANGSAAFTVTLDDGTEKCVTPTRSPGDEGATWRVDDDKSTFRFRVGDVEAGVLVSLTDRERSTDDDLPTEVPYAYSDAFIGLQVDGAYFPDSMHNKCDMTLTAVSAELVSGSFECADLEVMERGPFASSGDAPEQTSTAQKLVAAKGWFVASNRGD